MPNIKETWVMMKRCSEVWIVQLRSKVKWVAKGGLDSPLVARTLCRMFNICCFFSLTPAVKYSLSNNSRKTRNSANNSSIAEKNTYNQMFNKHNNSFRRKTNKFVSSNLLLCWFSHIATVKMGRVLCPALRCWLVSGKSSELWVSVGSAPEEYQRLSNVNCSPGKSEVYKMALQWAQAHTNT